MDRIVPAGVISSFQLRHWLAALGANASREAIVPTALAARLLAARSDHADRLDRTIARRRNRSSRRRGHRR